MFQSLLAPLVFTLSATVAEAAAEMGQVAMQVVAVEEVAEGL